MTLPAASKFNMYEVLPSSAPENEGSLVTMKAEGPTWEQPGNTQEGGAYPQELCPLWQFCYQEAPGPREALAQFRELCHQWLRPETHSKEQILELLVLEQFLTILPKELPAWIQTCPLQSGDEAATFLATLASQHGDPDPGQQATFYGQEQDMHLVVAEYPGASLEYQSLQFLQPGVSSLTCDPPQLPQESERWVPAGCAPPGIACLQEGHSKDSAAAAVPRV